jgi:hypothetical protein
MFIASFSNLGNIISDLITLSVGIYSVLVFGGFISLNHKDENAKQKWENYKQKWGKTMVILGSFLILFGLIKILFSLEILDWSSF